MLGFMGMGSSLRLIRLPAMNYLATKQQCGKKKKEM